MMILLIDKFSYKGDPYGKAGDKVKLIAEFGNVSIVEGSNGERFSVQKGEIKSQK